MCLLAWPWPQDCEFTYLSTQVLHLLGMEGPRTKEPAKYIRYIYNRVILENATVRAAAVSSLAQFGALVEELRPRVQVLLKRALHDNDDEVTVHTPLLAPCALLTSFALLTAAASIFLYNRRRLHLSAVEIRDKLVHKQGNVSASQKVSIVHDKQQRTAILGSKGAMLVISCVAFLSIDWLILLLYGGAQFG